MNYFPENTALWKKIEAAIKDAKTVFLSAHVNPDGDSIGCEMAFKRFLTNIHKKSRVINYSRTPDMYRFLDPKGSIESLKVKEELTKPPGKKDVVIFLDMGNYKRAGKITEFLLKNDAKIIVIDHHQPDMDVIEADIVVVNPTAAATGCLLYDLFCTIDKSVVDTKIATALMTAVTTDTGFFRYRNTTPTTHRIAAALIEHGAKTSSIRRKLNVGMPLPRQVLKGLAMSTIKTTECGRISYAYITQEMFNKAGALREHTEGIIQEIIRIKDTIVAALIIQEPLPEERNNFKVSFRSVGKIPVNTIASLLGGGGHKNAAGATLTGPLDDVIQTITRGAQKMLNELDESNGKD